MVMLFYSTICANAYLILSYFIYIFFYIFSPLFLYLFTSSSSDGLTNKGIGAYCRKGMKESEDFRLRDSNIT